MKPVQSVLAVCLLSVLAAGCASPASKSETSTSSVSVSQQESKKKDSKKTSSEKKDKEDKKEESASADNNASAAQNAAVVEDYDVDSVLAQASSLYGQRISVIGNLPQAAMPDGNGGYATYILSDGGNALRFNGSVNFGSCKARLTGTLQNENGEPVLNVDSAEQLTFDTAGTPQAEPEPDPQPQQTVYDVDTVLANAPSLVGQHIEVTGNLGQNASMDEQGRPILWLTSSTGQRLRFDGQISIGGCAAKLGGTLIQDDRGYVLQLDSYEQL